MNIPKAGKMQVVSSTPMMIIPNNRSPKMRMYEVNNAMAMP